MAKNVQHVSHIKSKQIVNGKPKLPDSSVLIEGEIAINFAEGVETISTKNESGNVVTFSSDDYYTEQKLGSGFTGENSGRTVTDALENLEIAVDQVIDDTTSGSSNAVSTSAVYGFVTSYTPSITVDQVLDDTTSASTNPVSSKAVYKAMTDKEIVWTNAFVSLSGSVSSHTENDTIHVTTNDKTKWNKVDNKQDVSGMTAYTTTADTNALSGTVTAHTADTDIHVTTSDKSTWNAKLDASDVEGFFGAVVYDSNTKRINFYNESTSSTVLGYVDATDFIKDGMVSNVEIKEVSGKGTCLVITFNSDAGKEAIEIPLTDIFNPNNYYTKQELTATTDYATVTKANSANTASTVALTGVTSADDLKAIEALDGTSGILKKTAANTWTLDTTVYSSATEVNAALETKVNSGDVVTVITPSNSGSSFPIATSVVAENEKVVSEALVELDSRKLDTSAYTPTDLSNYYTKDETSGATEIADAFNSVNTSIEDLSGQSETVAVALNVLKDEKLDVTAYTPSDLSNYYKKSETSGATELSTAFNAKADNNSFTAHTADTNIHVSSSDRTNWNGKFDNAKYEDSGTTKVINFYSGNVIKATIDATAFIKDGMVDSVAISGNNLVITFNTDAGKEAIEIPLTDIFNPNNYYMKSQTSGATELSTAFESVNSSITDLSGQSETVAAALNLLNERITQLEEQITALNGN